jgi:hypothetical protein
MKMLPPCKQGIIGAKHRVSGIYPAKDDSKNYRLERPKLSANPTWFILGIFHPILFIKE